MSFGKRLREIRKMNGFTLKDLRERSGLSIPYLSDIERDVSNPSLETIQKIANAYNISVRSLFALVEDLEESTHTIYPQCFREFIESPEYEKEIDQDWKDLLMGLHIRGKRPTSKREWVEIYLHLSRILA